MPQENYLPVKCIEILTCILVSICVVPLVAAALSNIWSGLGLHPLFEHPSFFFCEKPFFFYCALISITTFLGLLLLDKDNLLNPSADNGPVVRRALVGTMVIAYLSFLAALLWKSTDINPSPLTPMEVDLFKGLGAMVTTIMGFYFGASILNKLPALQQGSGLTPVTDGKAAGEPQSQPADKPAEVKKP